LHKARASRQTTPEALIEACLAHEEGSWPEFLRRYSNLIYSTIRKTGLRREDQEEAFQNTVIAIYRQLGHLRQSDRLTSWIIGIAWRQSINQVRLRSRDSSLVEYTDGAAEAADRTASAQAPIDEVRTALERAQRAQEGMERLPERCRRLLQLMFYQDPPLEYREIARREGIPIGSLGPTRTRCLEKLKKLLAERGWQP